VSPGRCSGMRPVGSSPTTWRLVRDGVERVEDVHKLAVLRANAIGDYLVSLPAIQALRAAYPAAELVLLGAGWHVGFLAGRPARSTAAWPCRRPSGCVTTGRQLRPPRSSGSSPVHGPSGSTWQSSCRGATERTRGGPRMSADLSTERARTGKTGWDGLSRRRAKCLVRRDLAGRVRTSRDPSWGVVVPKVTSAPSGSRRAATGVRNDRGARPKTVEDHDIRSCIDGQ